MSHRFITAVPVPGGGVGPSREVAGAVAAPGAMLHDLIHELRQPLSVVGSLAYYLELTSSDKQSAERLQQIQVMVGKINQILEENVRQLEHSSRYSFDS